jgi:hypothetical protein
MDFMVIMLGTMRTTGTSMSWTRKR